MAPSGVPLPAPGGETGGHVLVIDDDPVIQDLVESFLTRAGYRVTVAGSGPTGLFRARQLKPDVITLDINMPGMDGWSVLAALKNDPDLRDIPVVLLTAADEKNLGYALGATDYLMKPINRQQLAGLLRKYSALHRNSILIVEDDESASGLLRAVFLKDGWRVRTAANGRAALEEIKNAMPGLVLLDLMMPEMDGFSFLEEFQKFPHSEQTAVVVLTALDLTEEDRLRLHGRVARITAKGEGAESVLRKVHALVAQCTHANNAPAPEQHSLRAAETLQN